MHVFQEHQHGLLGRQRLDAPDQCLQGLALALVRAEIEVHTRVTYRQQVREQLGVLGQGQRVREEHGDLGQLRSRVVVTGEADGALELPDEGVECAVGMMGRAEVAQQGVRLSRDLLEGGGGQTRFADPRLAAHEHDLAGAGFGPLPAAGQQLDLLLPPDQRPEGRRMKRLEPALDRAQAEDAVGLDRFVETLEIEASEIAVFE